ncbi:DUF1348 family protein [Microcoleus sp. Pol11C3]|uniref:DUF1348 family protein n=1 Tax=Microcoleus sp. Pol11C3 TaxID=3055390 RepID=UPI004040C8F1
MCQFPIKIQEIIFGSNFAFFLVSYPDSATPEFLSGRDAIVQFLTRKWLKELDYRLIKELWTFGDNRMTVRFACE